MLSWSTGLGRLVGSTQRDEQFCIAVLIAPRRGPPLRASG